jgi:hypothetical protein
MFCSACGTELPTQAKFCFQCGGAQGRNEIRQPPVSAAWESCVVNSLVTKRQHFGGAVIFTFQARATGADGKEYVVAESRQWESWLNNLGKYHGDWDLDGGRKSGEPALNELASTLMNDGWEPLPVTGPWFKLRFRRRQSTS